MRLTYVRSKLNLTQKFVRLALNELNLCKICAKFNAKIVRAILKSTQNI